MSRRSRIWAVSAVCTATVACSGETGPNTGRSAPGELIRVFLGWLTLSVALAVTACHAPEADAPRTPAPEPTATSARTGAEEWDATPVEEPRVSTRVERDEDWSALDMPGDVQQMLGPPHRVRRFPVPAGVPGGLRDLYVWTDASPASPMKMVARTTAPDGSTVWLRQLPFPPAPLDIAKVRVEFHDLDGDGEPEILLWTRERDGAARGAAGAASEFLRVVSWTGEWPTMWLAWRTGAVDDGKGGLRFSLRAELEPSPGVCLRLLRNYDSATVPAHDVTATEVDGHAGDFECSERGAFRVAPAASLPAQFSSADPLFAKLALPPVHPSARDIPEPFRNGVDPRNRLVQSPTGRRIVFIERRWFDSELGYDSLFLGNTQKYLLALGAGQTRLLLSDCAGDSSISFSRDERWMAVECLDSVLAHYNGNYTSKVVDLDTGKVVAERTGCRAPKFTGERRAVCRRQLPATEQLIIDYEKTAHGDIRW